MQHKDQVPGLAAYFHKFCVGSEVNVVPTPVCGFHDGLVSELVKNKLVCGL